MDYQMKLINGKIKLVPIFKRMKIVDNLFGNSNQNAKQKIKPKPQKN